MKDNVHEGHRGRLKERFLEQGIDSFEAHNILELLLFYSIPRRDTNEIAHDLLKNFGTLKGVFDADFNDLIKVDGIKENSATLIKLIPAIARAYATDKYSSNFIFDTAEKIGEFFLDKYVGEKNEIIYLLLLNNRYEMLDIVKLHEGSVNSALISPRKIIDLVVKYNASMIVLAHNHPDGNAYPSMDDIETTADLMSTFDSVDVRLLEHYVVSNNDYYTIIHSTDSLKYHSKDNRDFFRRSLDPENNK
ncbi:MAG: RadC family protein [Clostridia bacterium]|nr:RadC family protein [Clostridia bacterium]MBR2944490.1 RadC family protein [Clostridia bacterium]